MKWIMFGIVVSLECGLVVLTWGDWTTAIGCGLIAAVAFYCGWLFCREAPGIKSLPLTHTLRAKLDQPINPRLLKRGIDVP